LKSSKHLKNYLHASGKRSTVLNYVLPGIFASIAPTVVIGLTAANLSCIQIVRDTEIEAVKYHCTAHCLDGIRQLMDEAECEIVKVSLVAGIRVGMDPDYGAAQRLYIFRGYVPNSRRLH